MPYRSDPVPRDVYLDEVERADALRAYLKNSAGMLGHAHQAMLGMMDALEELTGKRPEGVLRIELEVKAAQQKAEAMCVAQQRPLFGGPS